MKVLNQKKYKILVGMIIALMEVFTILYKSYSVFQLPWVGDLYYIMVRILIWIFSFF